MGFRLTENKGQQVYGIVSYVADTATDVENLPINVAPGSTCIVAATSDVYILNTQKTWVLL